MRMVGNAIATLLRIVLIFAVLAVIYDSVRQLITQILPASYWFEFTRVVILPEGRLAVVYRRSHGVDLPVGVITELIGPEGHQPCASSGQRIIEANTTRAVLPLVRALPDCRWERLQDGRYRLEMTAVVPLSGNFQKSVTLLSDNFLIIRDGAIAGATAVGTGDAS